MNEKGLAQQYDFARGRQSAPRTSNYEYDERNISPSQENGKMKLQRTLKTLEYFYKNEKYGRRRAKSFDPMSPNQEAWKEKDLDVIKVSERKPKSISFSEDCITSRSKKTAVNEEIKAISKRDDKRLKTQEIFRKDDANEYKIHYVTSPRAAGNRCTKVAGNHWAKVAGNGLRGEGNGGTKVAGNGGTKVAGNGGTKVAGNGGTKVAGNGGTKVAGNGGTNVAENGGTKVAGNGGTKVAGNGGTKVAGNGGTNVAENGATKVGGNYGTKIEGIDGTKVAGNGGTKIAGNDGNSQYKNNSLSKQNVNLPKSLMRQTIDDLGKSKANGKRKKKRQQDGDENKEETNAIMKKEIDEEEARRRRRRWSSSLTQLMKKDNEIISNLKARLIQKQSLAGVKAFCDELNMNNTDSLDGIKEEIKKFSCNLDETRKELKILRGGINDIGYVWKSFNEEREKFIELSNRVNECSYLHEVQVQNYKESKRERNQTF